MNTATMVPSTSRRIISTLRSSGRLEVCLDEQPIPAVEAGKVLIRVDAAPVNPADIKSMFCQIGPEQLETGDGWVAGQVGERVRETLAGRIDQPVAIGNEGTGMVVATADDPEERALLGKRVSVAAGGMFSDYRLVKSAECIVVPGDVSASLAAGAWINPMTALAMVETMKREGHGGLLLTAAASNLGRMVNRLCLADGIALVSIVRTQRGADVLGNLGTRHVCVSAEPDFDVQLAEALAETGATLAFDATGGGTLAGQILRAMDTALARTTHGYSAYGSRAHKQLYFFGGLDPAPVTFQRDFGMAWGMGGWLLQPALARFDTDTVAGMKDRVAQNLDTVFQAEYDVQIPLAGLLDPDHARNFARLATGGKYLVRPDRE